MNKKAEILHEHIIFIVLNVIFFSVMIFFIYLQASSSHLTEEETAKQIALLIDVAKPGTRIEINLKGLFDKAEKDNLDKRDAFKIDKEKNIVIIKGSEKSYYEYSYFNDVLIQYKFGDEKLGIKADTLIMEFYDKTGGESEEDSGE